MSRTGAVRDEDAVRKKFGVEPRLIPDYLALVGDAADGYPGVSGIGKVTAARLLKQHGAIEGWPSCLLVGGRDLALLFKDLATLRTDAPLFAGVDELEWHGPREDFEAWAELLGDGRLLQRIRTVQRHRET
ncbi:MAG: 5'-3' exonuclease H3TH domain-containing protein [Thermoleophilia bacterium]